MWECWISSFLKSSFTHIYKEQHYHQNLLPIQNPHDNNHQQNDDVQNPLAYFKMILGALFNRCNTSFRYLILALLSPLLFPLICAMFSCFCALELFSSLCRRRRRWRKRRKTVDDCGGDGGKIEGEEEGNGERLLQRYLEDQLILVAGSLYDCGEDDDEMEEIVGVDLEYFDGQSPICN